MKVYEANVNVTWRGQNGDLKSPVLFQATDQDIKRWVTESIRSGDVAGIAVDHAVNLNNFVVDRFAASNQVTHHRIFVRPKTPFG